MYARLQGKNVTTRGIQQRELDRDYKRLFQTRFPGVGGQDCLKVSCTYGMCYPKIIHFQNWCTCLLIPALELRQVGSIASAIAAAKSSVVTAWPS